MTVKIYLNDDDEIVINVIDDIANVDEECLFMGLPDVMQYYFARVMLDGLRRSSASINFKIDTNAVRRLMS